MLDPILTLRKNEYKGFETKEAHSEEKKLISRLLKKIFSIYKNQRANEKIKEIIKLIGKHFNLIGDDGEFIMYTPDNIFGILKDYIEKNFEKNFNEITKIFINQYFQKWGRYKGKIVYNGWELTGGGISSLGYDYKILDRHFVDYTLKPALWDYYQKHKIKAWSFIINNCITPTNKVTVI